MNDELLHSILSDIKGDLGELTRAVRGDGTDGNPGILVKIDRLAQSAIEEKARRLTAEKRLWSTVTGLVVAAFAAVLSWWHPVP